MRVRSSRKCEFSPSIAKSSRHGVTTIFRAHKGALRGHLCDSTAFLFGTPHVNTIDVVC